MTTNTTESIYLGNINGITFENLNSIIKSSYKDFLHPKILLEFLYNNKVTANAHTDPNLQKWQWERLQQSGAKIVYIVDRTYIHNNDILKFEFNPVFLSNNI